MFLQRPKRGESEDDVLRMQEEFLKSNQKPSAQVDKADKRKSSANTEQILDDGAGSSKRSRSEKPLPKDLVHRPSSLSDPGLSNVPVCGDIMERDVNVSNLQAPLPVTIAFPEVKSVDIKAYVPKVKKSIFAQQMEEMKNKNKQEIPSFRHSPKLHTPIHEGSVIVDGSGLGDAESILEVKRIHEENLAKIESMSKEEILNHQQQILTHLDAKIIDFLKNKRKNQQTSSRTEDAVFAMEVEESASVSSLKTSEKTSEKDPSSSQNAAATSLERSFVTEGSEGAHSEIELDESQLPINPSDVNKYVHMDKVEKDKLAWMTMLPEPNVLDPSTGQSARFDFEGKLLSFNNNEENIPTQSGLYHHGEQPELPGYSIEELFHMVRSTVQSQRVLSLQTLARIMSNNWQGLFDECLQSCLFDQLLNAGLVPLLRWSLDDNTDSVIAASVFALHNLLVCEPDELCLDRTFSWNLGHLSPFYKHPDAPEGDKLDEETSLQELTDAQIIELDVIKGLLRMDILPRFHYIFYVCRPQATIIEHMLKILIRIARHSLECAHKILDYPGLIQVICSEFLPSSWAFTDSSPEKINNAYGIPLWSAVKLLRILASAGRNIAVRLATDFNIMNSIMCYLTIDPSNESLPTAESTKLIMEALRIWRILMSYGLASQTFLDLFPILIRQLQFCQMLSITTNVERHNFDYEYASALLGNMEAVVGVATYNSLLVQMDTIMEDIPVAPPVDWSNVNGLFNLVDTCLQRWSHELLTNHTTASGLTLFGSCINFLSLFYQKLSKEPNWNVVGTLEKIEKSSKKILPLLQSSVFTTLLEHLKTHSTLLSAEQSDSKRHTKTLSSLESVMWAGDIVPVLREGTPFPFLISLSDVLITWSKMHHNLDKEIFKRLLAHPSLMMYLKNVISKQPLKFISCFTSIELHFLWNLIMLCFNTLSGDLQFYHTLTLHLLPLFHQGDEYYVYELLNSITFHSEFIVEKNDMSWALQQLDLKENLSITSATGKVLDAAEQKLICEIYEQVINIRSVYSNFISPSRVKQSRARVNQDCHLVDFLCYGISSSGVIPEDWIFQPIIQLHKDAAQREGEYSLEDVADVIKCLQWVTLLEIQKPEITSRIPYAVRFCHLATTFLAGSDLFLNKSIHTCLLVCLRNLLSKCKYSISFENMDWPGISLFDDFFTELLVQFEAVSYGDHLFTNYILVPLQQCYHKKWKLNLFREHSNAVHIFRISLNEVIIPIDNFLNPPEQDTELLSLYYLGLLKGQFSQDRNPLFYLMAIHHIHHFILKEEIHSEVQMRMLKGIVSIKQKVISHDILHYKEYNKECAKGFDTFVILPESLQKKIDAFH